MPTWWSPSAGLTRLWAEFADIDGGRLWVSLRWASGDEIPAVADRVELYDGDGNTCLAEVEQVDEWGILARLDLATWKSIRPQAEVDMSTRLIVHLHGDLVTM